MRAFGPGVQVAGMSARSCIVVQRVVNAVEKQKAARTNSTSGEVSASPLALLLMPAVPATPFALIVRLL